MYAGKKLSLRDFVSVYIQDNLGGKRNACRPTKNTGMKILHVSPLRDNQFSHRIYCSGRSVQKINDFLEAVMMDEFVKFVDNLREYAGYRPSKAMWEFIEKYDLDGDLTFAKMKKHYFRKKKLAQSLDTVN